MHMHMPRVAQAIPRHRACCRHKRAHTCMLQCAPPGSTALRRTCTNAVMSFSRSRSSPSLPGWLAASSALAASRAARLDACACADVSWLRTSSASCRAASAAAVASCARWQQAGLEAHACVRACERVTGMPHVYARVCMQAQHRRQHAHNGPTARSTKSAALRCTALPACHAARRCKQPVPSSPLPCARGQRGCPPPSAAQPPSPATPRPSARGHSEQAPAGAPTAAGGSSSDSAQLSLHCASTSGAAWRRQEAAHQQQGGSVLCEDACRLLRCALRLSPAGAAAASAGPPAWR